MITKEDERLARSRRARGSLETLGPLPFRKTMGDRSRGLQRERRRVGLSAARSRALAGVSLGRRRLGGICDRHQHICFAFAFWNEKDPILKERLFGLTNREGNHGEDVKEYYYYVDATPTNSYLKYLYKYPQGAYPYEQLVIENGRRDRTQTGIRTNRHGNF